MNWKQAKTRELYVIMFVDEAATSADKLAAKAEVERRKKQSHERMQNKEVSHYQK
jgi:hypothetical protein